jgi:hypothetical protein
VIVQVWPKQTPLVASRRTAIGAHRIGVMEWYFPVQIQFLL